MGRREKRGIIGIDLGTCYSRAGVWDPHNQKVEIISDDEGNRSIPSMMAFTPTETLVGKAAESQMGTNPCNTIFNFKRLIAGHFTYEPSFQADMDCWPFKVIAGNYGEPMVEVLLNGQKKEFPAEETLSMVLRKLKTMAETYLKHDVKDVVFTVPVKFNNLQRRVIKEACRIAGLGVMQIMDEPAALAMTYVSNNPYTKGRNILVFDLGGGSLDVSIFGVEGGKIEVKAIAGDMHLGGEDFDNRMLNYYAEKLQKRHKMDLSTNPEAMWRLRSECERAKKGLSLATEIAVNIEGLYEGKDVRIKFTRAKFEKLNADLFQKCIEVLKECMVEAHVGKEEIEEVVLVGGSTHIPRVQELVQEFFGGKEMSKKAFDLEEAVVYGAALQAAALNNAESHLVFVDETPFSLGIGGQDGLMHEVVQRGTPIPAREEIILTTRFDHRDSVAISVYEGERAMIADNNFLGELELRGISSCGAEAPKIRVCFDVGVDGILCVSAENQETGERSCMTIVGYREQLQREEMERMLVDAERFMGDDEEAKHMHILRKDLEDYIVDRKNRVVQQKGEGTLEMGVAEDIMGMLDVVEDWLVRSPNAQAEELQEKWSQLKSMCQPMNLRKRNQ